MASLRDLELKIHKIEERNKKVEADKAWETSWTRRIILFLLTYIVIVIFFVYAELPKPFVNSVVPALAFVISTLSLRFFKKVWLRYKK